MAAMSHPDATAALLAAIVASSDDAIVSKDLNGRVTSWNAAAERMFGYTASEMVGQSITRIIPVDRLPEEDYVLSRIRRGLQIDHFETVRQHKNGSLLDVSLTVSPVRASDGTIIGASKIARDIRERRRTERDMLRLAAIVASSDDAIISKDLNGIIQTWNRGAERMFGYTEAEATGRSIMLIIPAERTAEEDQVLTSIRAGQPVEHFETVRRRKDGRFIDVSLSVSPIRRPSGEVIGASKIARDITEQKRLRLAADDASRAKDEFLAALSHELRTPLNAVLGYTHMLQIGAIPEAHAPRALEIISRNAEMLTHLVNDVLDTSRIVTGRIRLSVRDCDVGAVAEEAIAVVAPAARAKSIRVDTQIERGLVMQADPDRIRQVLWNLLSNAVKFTPDGGRVGVAVTADPRSIRIVVEDTGIGISAEALPHIFNRFWQVDPTHMRTAGGLGLGLALARDFVELHGGHVEAQSEGLGRGARFQVVLPAVGVAAVEP
jgi:PAS domain S-box-containing protein